MSSATGSTTTSRPDPETGGSFVTTITTYPDKVVRHIERVDSAGQRWAFSDETVTQDADGNSVLDTHYEGASPSTGQRMVEDEHEVTAPGGTKQTSYHRTIQTATGTVDSTGTKIDYPDGRVSSADTSVDSATGTRRTETKNIAPNGASTTHTVFQDANGDTTSDTTTTYDPSTDPTPPDIDQSQASGLDELLGVDPEELRVPGSPPATASGSDDAPPVVPDTSRSSGERGPGGDEGPGGDKGPGGDEGPGSQGPGGDEGPAGKIDEGTHDDDDHKVQSAEGDPFH